FTDDPAVVTAAVGSKYAPVPLLQTVLPALRERPRRIALTATPCQLAGWYRATTLLPRLREYLVLAIGLFCGHVQTTDSLTAIGSTINVRYPDAATFVGWRCGPYPGCARFVTPEGEVREKPLYPWLDIAVPFFTPQRCFLCPDGGNWLSDLTLGDIHAGGTDETVVIARTAHGQQVLAAARDAGVLTYTAMTDAEKRATVVTGITRSKLRAGLERIAWHQRKGLPAPEFDYAPAVMCRAKIPGQTPGLLKYLLAMWWRHPGRLAWLRRHPRLLEWLGRQLYRFPTALPGYRLLRRLRRG
ncbi:MAG TPA: Coenzyme F420 hydrogenase/dehydrogenase, beta subunit C-terminal domain, partial [Armatimonadota bacterium]|nr:Coenzyme F420 hydrogenase/dehydrogenase, beta subunit C-terminal domain [Armatimonadota bacterium]